MAVVASQIRTATGPLDDTRSCPGERAGEDDRDDDEGIRNKQARQGGASTRRGVVGGKEDLAGPRPDPLVSWYEEGARSKAKSTYTRPPSVSLSRLL